MFGFFKKKKQSLSFEGLTPIQADMHSHLLPGIDDGSQNMEESISMIRELVDMGYKKLITTPHIMSDFYKNTPEIILGKLEEVRAELIKQNIDVELGAAAEYYLDEGLLSKLENKEKLLTFGDNYLLFETSYMNESQQLDSAVFMMQSQGYKPVMAHPERYVYLFGKFEKLQKIYDRGVLLQVNVNSLTGYYSKPSKMMAEELVQKGMVSFIGSDCHKDKHLEVLKEARKTKAYHSLLTQNCLLNNQLVERVAAAV